MSRRNVRPVRPFHTNLYEEDLLWLEARFGLQGDLPYGVGNAIRDIVHKRVEQMKARRNEILDSRSDPPISAEELETVSHGND